MTRSSQNPYISALQWHIDAGADEAWQDSPNDRVISATKLANPSPLTEERQAGEGANISTADFMGAAEAKIEATKIAAACNTLDELRAAMESFDGLSIKKTATQMVFADGNPSARVMFIGEAPGADEDRMGKPFVGPAGLLLDKIFASIGLARTAEDPDSAVYLTNVINWRPPGNRTASTGELDVSLPFIERHIALVAPKVLILCGGVCAKALLGRGESLSKLRGVFHDYRPLTSGISANPSVIPAIATYHPDLLLRTPMQKKSVWADMLMVADRLEQK